MSQTLTLAVLKGAVSGALAAAAVDAQAFRSWHSFDDAVRYDWKLAAWRWAQGAVTGAVAALTASFGFGL